MDTYTQGYITSFYAKIDKTGSCWLWTGYCKPNGYGSVQIKDKKHLCHRVSYNIHKGTIPKGLVIDHLCRVKNCVNPEHLEAVTQAENIRRSPVSIATINAKRTYCKNGHKFTPENTYHRPSGGRACKECVYIAQSIQSKAKILARESVYA